MVDVPKSLVSLLRDDQAAKEWIAEFPGLADHYLQRWRCRLDGPVTAGAVAVVMPVRSPDGLAVIKLSSPHPGNADEHKALRLWDGGAAVKMIDADPAGFALLLERLTSRHLDAPTDDGISIGGRLSARLAVAATPDVQRLSDTTAEWEEQIRCDYHDANAPLSDRVLGAAVETIRDLGHDPTETMLHGNLHGKNILHADRGWVAIDPKGMAGTAAFAP